MGTCHDNSRQTWKRPLLLLLLLAGAAATATPEDARTIARENAAFDADLLHRELTGAGEMMVADGQDGQDSAVCREGRCNTGPPEGWDRLGSDWKHLEIKKGASPSPCRFAGQDDTLGDRMAAWSMPKF